MAYGDYYLRGRAPQMRDLLDPRAALAAQAQGWTPRSAQTLGDDGPTPPGQEEPPAYPGAPPPQPPPPSVPQGPPPGKSKPPGAPGNGGIAASGTAGSATSRYGNADIPGAKESGLWWSNTGTLRGFNTAGRSREDRGAFTIKNVSGMIFSGLEAKPSNLPLAVERLRANGFPEAKQVGFDKIDYGDGRPVDVMENADPEKDTSTGWQWGVEDASGDQANGKSKATPTVRVGASMGMPSAAGFGASTPYGAAGTGAPGVSDPRAALIDPMDPAYRGPSFRDWLAESEGYF